MSITPDQQRDFDDFQETFATAGWRKLVEQANKQIYEHQADALEAKSWDVVCYLRGRAEALAELANFEDTIQVQYNMMVEEEEHAVV